MSLRPRHLLLPAVLAVMPGARAQDTLLTLDEAKEDIERPLERR